MRKDGDKAEDIPCGIEVGVQKENAGHDGGREMRMVVTDG